MLRLSQRRYFQRIEIELHADEAAVRSKDLRQDLSYTVDYLELGVRRVYKTDTSYLFGEILFACFFLLEFGLLLHTLFTAPVFGELVFWSLASALFLALWCFVHFGAKKRFLYLTGGRQQLELFQDRPSEAEVEAFVDELTRRIRCTHREEYLTWTPTTTKVEKQQRIEWLRKMRILSNDEAEAILRTLDTAPDNPAIGFN